ncbi:LppM family (lipo)protein [Natronoglycomyces albus]|uniref:LppM domain-containing protein n=1 Tax=Natronoglycomyces albus TaxID=2811108 RepID=A0A895XHB5_9ACTN|nr:hypothetical protein [Natronoglycomyces albus]QSB04317.1 hypothetical protein JQS30_10955 [Natronoglycomyces albus]
MRYRPLLLIVGTLVTLLASTGCMRLELDLVINDDDTVDGHIVAAWSDDFLAEAASADIDFDPDQADALIDALLGDLPGIEDRRDYRQDGFSGETASFARQPLSDFASLEEGQDSLQIVRDGSRYQLTAYWNLQGYDPLEFDLSEQVPSPEITLSVTFPGRVTAHNGDLDGRTVTWNLALGEEHHLTAEAAGRNAGMLLATVGGGTVAILALMGLWQYRMLRRYSL